LIHQPRYAALLTPSPSFPHSSAGGCLRDKRAPVEAAIETEKQVIAPFCEWKHHGRPAGNGWNRSTNNARFGTDYFNRTGMAKSNMVVAGSYSRQGEWRQSCFTG
jgi:hypothetical protein